jgi:hypothetical protein
VIETESEYSPGQVKEATPDNREVCRIRRGMPEAKRVKKSERDERSEGEEEGRGGIGSGGELDKEELE